MLEDVLMSIKVVLHMKKVTRYLSSLQVRLMARSSPVEVGHKLLIAGKKATHLLTLTSFVMAVCVGPRPGHM
jgi:hypothetical protein